MATEEFNSLFEKAETYFKGFMGKPGHNPFFKLEELIKIRKSFEKGDRDKSLALLKAIRLEPPLTQEKPLTIIKENKPLAGPEVTKETQKSGVDIQTPKPVEPPKQSSSNKK